MFVWALECALQGKTYNITVMQRKILYPRQMQRGSKRANLPITLHT